MIYCHQRSYIISTTYHQKNPLIPQIFAKKKLKMNSSKKGDSYSEAREYSTRRTTRTRATTATTTTNNHTLTLLHILRGLCLLNRFPHHLGIRSRPGNSQWAMKHISGCLIRILFNRDQMVASELASPSVAGLVSIIPMANPQCSKQLGNSQPLWKVEGISSCPENSQYPKSSKYYPLEVRCFAWYMFWGSRKIPPKTRCQRKPRVTMAGK